MYRPRDPLWTNPDYLPYYKEFSNTIPVDLEKARREPPPYAAGSQSAVGIGDIHVFKIATTKIYCYQSVEAVEASENMAIVWFHGGGYVLGNARSEHALLTRLTKELNCIIFSVEYPLAPEHPLPAAMLVADEVVRWVFNQGCTKYRLDPDCIIVGGVDAGANLAAVTAFCHANTNPAHNLLQQILIAPFINNEAIETDTRRAAAQKLDIGSRFGPTVLDLHKYQKLYMSTPTKCSGPMRNLNLFEPSYFPKALAAGLFLLAKDDVLFREAYDYALHMDRAGVVVNLHVAKGAPHAFLDMTKVPETQRIIRDICDGVRERQRALRLRRSEGKRKHKVDLEMVDKISVPTCN